MGLYLYYFGSIILVLLYVKLIFEVFSKWQDGEKSIIHKPSHELPTISVIIAARNEASQINQTIESVLENDYPTDKWELIVIDDHSTDDTAKIVAAYDQVKLITLANDDLTGKKNAITRGVQEATGEIILTTDADCIVGSQWIKTIASAYEAHTEVTTGMVYFGEQEAMLPQFQQFDILSTMGMTYYGISKAKFYTANGANFSFKKKTFLKHNGYEGNLDYASGDDMFFVQKVAKSSSEVVRCIQDRAAAVVTAPMTSLAAFLEQRKRWATKSKAYEDKGIYYPLILVVLLNASILLNILLIPFFDSITLFILLMQLMIKWIIDYLYLYHLTQYFKVGFKPIHFFVCSAWYPFYMIFMGFSGIFFKTYRWKGRVQQ